MPDRNTERGNNGSSGWTNPVIIPKTTEEARFFIRKYGGVILNGSKPGVEGAINTVEGEKASSSDWFG